MRMIPRRLEVALDSAGQVLEVALCYQVTAGAEGRVVAEQRDVLELSPADVTLLAGQAAAAAAQVRAREQLS